MYDKPTKINNRSIEVDRFNDIPWHDSKFLGLSVFQDEKLGLDIVCWFLRLWQNDPRSLRKAILIFEGATIVRTNLDLDGKRVVADDISDASCMSDSELKRQIEKELFYEHYPLADYFHFQLNLVDPGGQISVFAKSFRLVWVDYELPYGTGVFPPGSAV